MKNSTETLVNCCLGILLGIVIVMLMLVCLDLTDQSEMKASINQPKYTVTLYNHDGSIRGTYHNVTEFHTSLSSKSSYGSASSVLCLPEYGVYINGEWVITPEKD